MFGIADYGAFVVAIIVFLAIPGPGNLALLTATGKGGVRSTEPSDWINEEMEDHSPKVSMPIIEKPEFFKFNVL